VDTTAADLRLQWSFTTSDERGEAVCAVGGRMTLEPSIYGGEAFEPLVVRLDQGATAEVTVREETGSAEERLVVEVTGAE
jgi:hypothetical protein